MRWKWNWFRGCYYKGLARIFFIPLARGCCGIIIIDEGGNTIVTPYDEGRSNRSKCTISQSRFARVIGTPGILSAEEAQPYIAILRQALADAGNRTIDLDQ